MSSIYDYNPKQNRRRVPEVRPSRRRPQRNTTRQWLGYSATLIILLGGLCLLAYGILSCQMAGSIRVKNRPPTSQPSR